MDVEDDNPDIFSSSTHFIGALRAPTPAEDPEGSGKIALAVQAWSEACIRIPRKRVIIRDWILATWLNVSEA